MTTFWIFWIFNALVSLVPIYFFFVGLNDGTVSSRNIGIWFLLLLVVAVVLVGSLLLKAANQMALAKVLLILAAIPGICVVLYFLVVLTMHPDFK